MPKRRTGPNCGAGEFERRTTTYPLTLPSRQMLVGRVKVNHCVGCDHLIPTPEGREKLLRSLPMFGMMLEPAGRSEDLLSATNIEHSRPGEVPKGGNLATAALRRFRLLR